MSTEESKTSKIDESIPEESKKDNVSVSNQEVSESYLSYPDYYPSLDYIQPLNASAPKKGRKIVPIVDDRLDFLALPKKDFLDVKDPQPRPDGTVPEQGLPPWSFLPLQTKIPADGFMTQVTMRKLEDELLEHPEGIKFDQSDPNNRCRPVKEYNRLFDPNLKLLFSKKCERDNMLREGFVSESGRVVTTLKNVNDYRVYQRKIKAEILQQKYRDKDEEERKAREMKIRERKLLEDEKTKNERCQAALRSYIKNVVTRTNEGSMEKQRERDIRILNAKMSIPRIVYGNRTHAKQRREEIFERHLQYKYGSDDWKKEVLSAMAEDDVERVLSLCRRQEKEAIEKSLKKKDFYEQKANAEIQWLERGIEVENKAMMDREDRIKARKDGYTRKRMPAKSPHSKQTNESAESEKGVRNKESDLTYVTAEDVVTEDRSSPSTSWVVDDTEHSDSETTTHSGVQKLAKSGKDGKKKDKDGGKS